MSKHINFKIEDLRNKLAIENKLQPFIFTYVNKHKELKNLNTPKVWDTKFSEPEKIEDQDSMTREKISIIANCLKNKEQPIKLLDVGIGQAFLEQELTKCNINFKLSAVDISKLSIERAKKNYNAKTFCDDALKIDKLFKPKSFDTIVAIELIEHISPNKIFPFYKKVRTLLKDNGIFIISTPLNEGLRYMKENPSAHVREYTIPILNAEFKLSNFEIMKIKTLYAFQKYYFIKKLVAKIFPFRWKPNNIIIVANKNEKN